jgi:hypothetical protein
MFPLLLLIEKILIYYMTGNFARIIFTGLLIGYILHEFIHSLIHNN